MWTHGLILLLVNHLNGNSSFLHECCHALQVIQATPLPPPPTTNFTRQGFPPARSDAWGYHVVGLMGDAIMVTLCTCLRSSLKGHSHHSGSQWWCYYGHTVYLPQVLTKGAQLSQWWPVVMLLWSCCVMSAFCIPCLRSSLKGHSRHSGGQPVPMKELWRRELTHVTRSIEMTSSTPRNWHHSQRIATQPTPTL